MAKKKEKSTAAIKPQYVKDSKGKTTHIYIPYLNYKSIEDKLKEYERVKKEEGIKWIQISKEKKSLSKSKKSK